MRKDFHKIFLVLFAPVVMVVLYHYGIQHPTAQKQSAAIQHENITGITIHDKITGITIRNKPTGPTLADLPEGVEGCGPVWFTESGEAFVWPWVEVRTWADRCGWKIKHINGMWYARMIGSFDDGTVTGYRDLDIANGVPVLLDKHYTFFKNN